MTTEMMTPADVAAVCGGNRDNDGFFGGGNGWWIILLFLFAGGWGGGFGGWGGGGGANGPGFQGYATRADINEGFAFNGLQSGIQAIQQGICDSTYALNNAIQGGFNSTQMGMMQGFNGVEKGFCNLSAQLAQCCCDNREAIAQVRYDMATQACDTRNTIQTATRDLMENQNNNARAIMDYLTQNQIETLRSENQALKFQASQSAQNAFIAANQEAQTAELIRRLGRDVPVPAYVVPNPNCCYPQQYNFGGCGCNA